MTHSYVGMSDTSKLLELMRTPGSVCLLSAGGADDHKKLPPGGAHEEEGRGAGQTQRVRGQDPVCISKTPGE